MPANRSESADAVSAPAEKDHEVNLAGEQQAEAGHKLERLLFKVPNLRVLAAIVLSALLWALPVAIIWVGGTIVGWLMNPQKDLGQISQFYFSVPDSNSRFSLAAVEPLTIKGANFT